MILKVRGKRKLNGTVRISGSKNSAVAIIPAAILCDENVVIRNIPDIKDVRTLLEILEEQGYSILFENNVLKISTVEKPSVIYKSSKVAKLRGSTYLMGATIGKYHKTTIKYFGGCNLGERPIDYHLAGFKKLNIKIKETNDFLVLKTRKIKSAVIDLKFPSVGATINLVLASVKCCGEVKINNAAIEPEVVDVCNFLVSMGAIINGIGTKNLQIFGVKSLHSTDYTIISDRIEAGTYLILGSLATGEGVTVENLNYEHLTSLINVLQEIGLKLTVESDKITIKNDGNLIPYNLKTGVYPNFPTDLGPLISILFTQIEGESSIEETIFSNRFSHVSELIKMNANILLSNNTLKVSGGNPLKPANVECKDLRGAASLVLASTLTKGYTYINNIDVLFRGYENPLDKLTSLGLKVELIE